MQYLLRLVEGLRGAGLVDSHVFAVEERVRAQTQELRSPTTGAAEEINLLEAGL